jgi:hypothetical protein
MKNAKLSFLDGSPDSTLQPSSSEVVTPRAAGRQTCPPKATGDSSLWRTILDEHGEDILEHASDQFLDLVMSRRLKTIKAEDLVCMLARADRLGYSEVDIFHDDNETVNTIHEAQRIARICLDATSNPISRRRDRSDSDCTDSLQPHTSADRAAKRLRLSEHEGPLAKGAYLIRWERGQHSI